MTELDKANQRLFISSLETLRDSQFLGWMAMTFQEQDTELGDYVARRLNLIALRVGSVLEVDDG